LDEKQAHSPLISVVIPCRNEQQHIVACIEAVLANNYPNFEVIVVDGMSEDGTRAVLKAFDAAKVKIVDNPAKVTPAAFNLGIENANGYFICIVGARMILQPNYLTTCSTFLQNDAQLGCVGGAINNQYENVESEQIAYAMASPFGVGGGNFRTLDKDQEVDTVSAPMYRKAIFKQLDVFDERLVRNQDDEFNYRVTKAGYKILQTTQTSYEYYVRAKRAQLFKQYFQYGYWKVFVNKKHSAITTIRQIVPMLLVLFLTVGMILALVHPYLSILYGAGTLLYIAVSAFSAYSIVSVKKAEHLSGLDIMTIFWILHLGYGCGYLKGIWEFLVLNKKPSEQQKELSR
jgi:glycosyltransferase involved in cell wall biosynthesis